jgi:hypothetical protein
MPQRLVKTAASDGVLDHGMLVFSRLAFAGCLSFLHQVAEVIDLLAQPPLAQHD